MAGFHDEIAVWPEDWRDRWEERSAIMEVEGAMSRPKAEFHAYRDVKKQMENANASDR